MPNLDIDIKNACIKQLREDWKNANYYYFKNEMKIPNIDLLYSRNILGKWQGGLKRNLYICSDFIDSYSWQYVQEVLYHEMAHQYVEEVLGITGDVPHGYAFKKICNENGFDHRAGGDVKDWFDEKKCPGGYSKNHKILDKVKKLFSLAQSCNQHEAESAMTKAQELLLKHNLSLLKMEVDNKYINKHIGEVGRKNPVKSLITMIINEFFFVEIIWVFGYDYHKNKKGRILEIFGTPENVELAEYVYDYLHNVSEKLWLDYKSEMKISENKHRRTYIYGLLNGFYEKLKVKGVENKTKKLIWKGDPGLKKYYLKRNPKIHNSRFSYSKSCMETYDSGVSRGRKIIINKGIKTNTSGKTYLLN